MVTTHTSTLKRQGYNIIHQDLRGNYPIKLEPMLIMFFHLNIGFLESLLNWQVEQPLNI